MTSTKTPREQYAAAAHAPLVETPPPAVWPHRHLLDLDAVSPEEIATVLRSAQAMKAMLRRDVKKAPTLRGRTIVTLFSEPSTRTRVSFETAGKLLSADVINLSSGGSSTEKGESLVDTVLTLQAAAADVLVMRHSHSGAPYLAAKTLERTAVINAGDGAHAHPTQALLDLFTIKERLGSLEGQACGNRWRHLPQPRRAVGPVGALQDGREARAVRATHAHALGPAQTPR